MSDRRRIAEGELFAGGPSAGRVAKRQDASHSAVWAGKVLERNVTGIPRLRHPSAGQATRGHEQYSARNIRLWVEEV